MWIEDARPSQGTMWATFEGGRKHMNQEDNHMDMHGKIPQINTNCNLSSGLSHPYWGWGGGGVINTYFISTKNKCSHSYLYSHSASMECLEGFFFFSFFFFNKCHFFGHIAILHGYQELPYMFLHTKDKERHSSSVSHDS